MEGKTNASLVVKYRPRRLADVLGQLHVTEAMKNFTRAPYPTAFLFAGETGVGKTSAAIALAHELGVQVEDDELGGLYDLASGEQTGDSVRKIKAQLRLRPLFGSGWRVLVVNECDRMSHGAEATWLDVLERIPEHVVIVFTTNVDNKLSRRFMDRCEFFHFTSETERLRPYLADLAKRVWKEEGLAGEPPYLDKLGLPCLDGPDALHASFRLLLQQMQRLLIGESKREDLSHDAA